VDSQLSGPAATRTFVLGAVYDFLDQCCQRENPLVLGQGYPRDRAVAELERWAQSRGLPVAEIDPAMFRNAIKSGVLK
jgi:hypothetical protein